MGLTSSEPETASSADNSAHLSKNMEPPKYPDEGPLRAAGSFIAASSGRPNTS